MFIVQLDGRSMSLESGRYMETIGRAIWCSLHTANSANALFFRLAQWVTIYLLWASYWTYEQLLNLITEKVRKISSSRGGIWIQIVWHMRYVFEFEKRGWKDINRVQYHTGRSNFNFDTSSGKSISSGLKALAKRFDLSFLFGTAPRDFTINQ